MDKKQVNHSVTRAAVKDFIYGHLDEWAYGIFQKLADDQFIKDWYKEKFWQFDHEFEVDAEELEEMRSEFLRDFTILAEQYASESNEEELEARYELTREED